MSDQRELTEDAQADRASFEAEYGDGNCYCHLSPPCSSCTHPGNPLNQDEDESCWTTSGQSDGTDDACHSCAGTGEGSHEGANCMTCKGSGETK